MHQTVARVIPPMAGPLIDHGRDLSALAFGLSTSLHTAIKKNRTDVVRVLIRKGPILMRSTAAVRGAEPGIVLRSP